MMLMQYLENRPGSPDFHNLAGQNFTLTKHGPLPTSTTGSMPNASKCTLTFGRWVVASCTACIKPRWPATIDMSLCIEISQSGGNIEASFRPAIEVHGEPGGDRDVRADPGTVLLRASGRKKTAWCRGFVKVFDYGRKRCDADAAGDQKMEGGRRIYGESIDWLRYFERLTGAKFFADPAGSAISCANAADSELVRGRSRACAQRVVAFEPIGQMNADVRTRCGNLGACP